MTHLLRCPSVSHHAFVGQTESLMLLLALLVATNTRGQISGTLDFDVDPGFTIEDGGAENVIVDVRTEDSVMQLRMTRDGAPERVTLPIGQTVVGPALDLRARIRFAVRAQGSTGADINVGFFNTNDPTVTGIDTNTTAAVIEGIFSGNYPSRIFGGNYDRLSLNAAFNTWYVYEFQFAPAENPQDIINELNWFEGDGSTLIDGISGGAMDLVDELNAIGFGNEDSSDALQNITAVIDFMTWSVDAPLPPDPTFAPDCAIIGSCAIPGDLDGDDDVDGADLLDWQRGDPLSPTDLAAWKENYGTGVTLTAASTAAPEPATWILWMLGIAALPCRLRRVDLSWAH